MEDLSVTFDWANRNLPSIIGGIILGLAILVIGRWLARWISRIVVRYLTRASVDKTAINFLQAVVYVGLLAVVVISALEAAGIHTTNLTALLATAGLAVSLAIKDALSNLSAGLLILTQKPYQVGDEVNAAGANGIVEQVGMFSTTLRTPDNVRVIVPNSSVTTNNISNYTAYAVRRIDLVVGIRYDGSVVQAREALMSMLREHPLVLDEPAPAVDVLELAESSVRLAIRPWVNTPDYARVRFDVLEQIKLRFDDTGISAPFPQREITLHTPISA
jgi:small conductance mechanosensitive channel